MDNKKIVKEDKDDEEEERGRDLMPGVVFPPGYRFYPTEEELITFYLHRKLLLDGNTTTATNNNNRDDIINLDNFNLVIPLVHIFDLDPWLLPRTLFIANLSIIFINFVMNIFFF